MNGERAGGERRKEKAAKGKGGEKTEEEGEEEVGGEIILLSPFPPLFNPSISNLLLV